MIPSLLVTKWDGTQVDRIDFQVSCPASQLVTNSYGYQLRWLPSQLVTKSDGYQVSWLPSLEGEGKGESGGCEGGRCEGEGEWEWN